ncbi:MAG: hypothetical protein K6B70_02240, partial [Clostridia bacterium]|nr:hypothetical protein [Clostridia bacterium]
GLTGEYSTAKVVFNLVKATILILIIPTLFSFAYKFQASVMNENFIVKLVTGRKTENSNAGAAFTIPVFEGFFYLNDLGNNTPDAVEAYQNYEDAAYNYSKSIEEFSYFFNDDNTLDDGGYVFDGEAKTINYRFPLSSVAGCFVAFVLLIYCFDIAVRAVKLAFLEVVSPFPVLIAIIPKQDKIFNNWLKNTLKTYFELFLRIFVLSLGTYLIGRLDEILSNIEIEGNMFFLTKTFIILGIVMFIRKAPKLISEIFGIDMKNANMSLRDRLRDSGLTALAGGALATGAYVGSTWSALKDRKDIGTAGKIGRGFLRTNPISTLAHGTRLGLVDGWRNGTLKGVGAAGNYAVQQERAYARGSNWLKTNFELLRDDLGFMSYYDRLNAAGDIREGSQLRVIESTLRKGQTIYDNFAREKEKTYGFDEKKRANERAISKYDSMKQKAEDQVGKQTSKTVASVRAFSASKEKLDTLTFDMAKDANGNMSLMKSTTKKMDADEMRKQLVKLDEANANGLVSSSDYSSLRNYYEKRINAFDNQGYKLSAGYVNMNGVQIDAEMKRLDQALASKAITPEQHKEYTDYYVSKKKGLAKQNTSDAILYETQLRNFSNQGQVLDYIGTDYNSCNEGFKEYATKYCFEDYKDANFEAYKEQWIKDHPDENPEYAEGDFDKQYQEKFRFATHKDMSDAITGTMFDGSSRDAKFDIGRTNNLSELAYQVALYREEARDDSVNLVYNYPDRNRDGSATKHEVTGVNSMFGEDIFKGKDHLVNTNQVIDRVKARIYSEPIDFDVPRQFQGVYGQVRSMDELGRFNDVMKNEKKAVQEAEAPNKDYIKAMATNKEASENIKKTRNQYGIFRANHNKK